MEKVVSLNRLSSHGKGIAVLILLGVIWGYSVFRTQIGEDAEWAGLLIALGALSVFSFFFHTGGFTTPPSQWHFAGLAFLFALYVALQLIPLPIGLLRWLSPARVEIHDGLGTLAAAPSSLVSISALPSVTMDHLMQILAYGLVFFLVTDIAVSIRKKVWLLAIPIIAIASLQAIVGLLQVGMGEPGTLARGGYINRNHFAGLLEMSFPFAVMGAAASVRRVRSEGSLKWASLACVCLGAATLLLIGILSSLSRMGFVACLFSVLVMGLSFLVAGSSHALRRKALLGLAFLILLAFVFLPSDPLIARFADLSSAEEVSEQNRLQVWKETLGLIRDFPWAGSGLGSYESVFLRHKQIGEMLRDNYAHNDYLQGLAELGLLGFSLVAAFLSLVLVKAASAIFAAATPSVRYLAVACLGSMAAILLHSLTDFNLYVQPNAMLLSWVSAIAVSHSFAPAS
jgi:O-antigen ligase